MLDIIFWFAEIVIWLAVAMRILKRFLRVWSAPHRHRRRPAQSNHWSNRIAFGSTCTNFEAERKSLTRQLRNDHEKVRAIAANVLGNGRVAGLPDLQKRIDTAEDRLKAIGIVLQSLQSQAIDTAGNLEVPA